MYRRGDVVTLNIDKHEGAGENSLYIRSGITGMIVNSGPACSEGDYSYVVDCGPEGQWNCRHGELDGLGHTSDDEEGWDNEEQDSEPERDLPPPLSIPANPDEQIRFGVEYTAPTPQLRGYETIEYGPLTKDKKVSFEDDLARIAAEAARNGG